KVALARKLLEDGRKNEANRAEQFVLLRRAGEVARDAGDTAAMLEAVDAMVAAGFDIRPLQVKARLLKQLVSVPGGATQVSAVITACVKFAEETAAGGAPDEALDVLGAAKKTLADSTKRAQNANRVARAALARARSSADKAAQEKKADEAQAELEAIKSAQTALADCAKGLQQVRHEHEVILAAQEKLKTDPDDADACLAVGRWYCFYEGDWDEGLKLLAKGSDDALKSLAAEELASKPAKAEDKVARGDAWWDLGEKATGKTKAAMRRRAGQWYQEALPELASGLGKSRVEKRLAQAADEPAPETVSRPAHILPPLAVAPFNERTALLHQKRWAKYLGVPVVQANSIGMKLALIPPGEFDMGSPKELIGTEARLHANDGWYRDRLPGEGPQHRIQITRPFFVGVTCVTQGEYERVMGTNPSKFQGDPKRPVEQVSWNEAVEFCRKVSELPGEKEAKRRYGLPTEAQWEYACRAGSQSRWSFGDDPAKLGEYGWFNGNSGGMSHPVGQKQPNVWGLYDMYGNVWEWCGDGYEKGYYENSPKDDPAGSSGGSQRAFRGGSWIIAAWACRSAFRDGRGPAERDNNLGFRVSVSLADDAGGKSPTATALAPVEHHAQVEAAPEASGRPARVHPPLAVAPCNEKTAILHQKRWAKYLGAPVVQANSIGMKLALIPPGEFQMGSPKELIEEEWRLHGGYGWYKDHLLGEGPQHRVRITKPFWLGVTEVTQEEYERVMSSSPSKFQGNGKRPVEQVSWNDAIEFCRKLSELSGEKMAKRRYDLPTEAQWEHACRAGNMGRFSFSSARGEILKETEEKELAEYGWFGENAGGLTHAVGSKRASVWGLYDMHGNVWEWCRDYYDKGYYAESPTDDPVGPSGGLNRVSRGGSWVFPACACRSALRHYDVPGGRVDSVGFRVSVSLADDAGGKSPTATALAPVKHHAQVEAVPEVERAAW
ncbi:MAG: formylglycine-generating enzyme family protein, partial [Thermoguttaceae bacterium]